MCRPSTRNRSTHQSTGETPRDTKHPRGMASGLTYVCVRTRMCVSHSVVSDFSVTARAVASQAPLSMELSRQEYWSGLPFPPPGDLPDPGIEPGLLHCRQILYHLSQKGSPTRVDIKSDPTCRPSLHSNTRF